MTQRPPPAPGRDAATASLIRRVLARGDLRLDDAERAQLKALPAPDEAVCKLLAADAFNRRDGAAAVVYAARALELSDTAENQANYISSLRRAGRQRAALAFLDTRATRIEALRKATWMGEIHGVLGELERARHWGRVALELKDRAAAPSAPLRSSPPRPGLKVLSFSVWGQDRRYHDGALRNAIVAAHLYPGWVPRFHVDASVPEGLCKALMAEGAQVRHMPPSLPAHSHGLFWRFLVEDDPEVAVYAVRDADSVLSVREWAAVRDWLDGPQPFHVMRDWPTHCELMLAGMWGARCGNLPAMGPAIDTYLAQHGHVMGDRARDQKFLAEVIWPHVRGRVQAHDSQFGWGDPFPPGTDLPGSMHVGQNDLARRQARGPLPGQGPAG